MCMGGSKPKAPPPPPPPPQAPQTPVDADPVAVANRRNQKRGTGVIDDSSGTLLAGSPAAAPQTAMIGGNTLLGGGRSA